MLGEEVQDGADHILPVRSKGQTVPVDGRGLPGAVEGQDVVAAFLSADGAEEVQLFGSTVEPVVHHQRRLRTLSRRPIEVAVQHGVLIWDLHGSDTRDVGDGITEAGDTALVGVVDARVVRIAMQEELGRPVVGGSPQQPVPRADRVACAGFHLQTVGGGQPGVVPAVVVAGGDLGGGCDDLTDVRATVDGQAEIAQGLEPELPIVLEHQLLHCVSLSTRARKVRGGRPVRRWTVSVTRSSAPSAMARSMPASMAANSTGTSAVRRSRNCS